MKILHLIDSGGIYGAEKMLISLTEEQKLAGHHPLIGSIREPGSSSKPLELEAQKEGIDVITFDMKKGFNLVAAFKIVQYAKNNNVDILHSHGYKTNILIGLLPSLFRKIPMLSTLHGWTNTGGFTKIRLYDELDAFALRFVDKVILVNRTMLVKKQIKRIPAKKIAVINNGVTINTSKLSTIPHDQLIDICFSDQVVKNKLKSSIKHSRIIASIGRLSHEKGFLTLIEALRILHKEHNHKFTLLIVGEGEDRKTLEKEAARHGLSEYLILTGYIDDAFRILPLVDYYVISSITEGLPITLLEAMSLEVPIIATEVGGIPDVLENGKDSLLIKPNDANAIADSILKLIENPNLAKDITERSKAKVVNEYSSKAMANNYMNVYTEFCNS
ncbi:MAG: glycosyltransferase [Candidatus Thiodiazotropha sp.]